MLASTMSCWLMRGEPRVQPDSHAQQPLPPSARACSVLAQRQRRRSLLRCAHSAAQPRFLAMRMHARPSAFSASTHSGQALQQHPPRRERRHSALRTSQALPIRLPTSLAWLRAGHVCVENAERRAARHAHPSEHSFQVLESRRARSALLATARTSASRCRMRAHPRCLRLRSGSDVEWKSWGRRADNRAAIDWQDRSPWRQNLYCSERYRLSVQLQVTRHQINLGRWCCATASECCWCARKCILVSRPHLVQEPEQFAIQPQSASALHRLSPSSSIQWHALLRPTPATPCRCPLGAQLWPVLASARRKTPANTANQPALRMSRSIFALLTLDSACLRSSFVTFATAACAHWAHAFPFPIFRSLFTTSTLTHTSQPGQQRTAA
jgi:hypothetical protein